MAKQEPKGKNLIEINRLPTKVQPKIEQNTAATKSAAKRLFIDTTQDSRQSFIDLAVFVQTIDVVLGCGKTATVSGSSYRIRR